MGTDGANLLELWWMESPQLLMIAIQLLLSDNQAIKTSGLHSVPKDPPSPPSIAPPPDCATTVATDPQEFLPKLMSSTYKATLPTPHPPPQSRTAPVIYLCNGKSLIC